MTAVSLLAAALISLPLGPGRAALPPTFSSISLLAPDGGEILRGGDSFPVRWNATQDNATELPTTIEFSSDGGANYSLLDAGNYSTNGASYDWAVPTLDTVFGRIRVCVDEGVGNWSCRASSADFTIDSTPPLLVYVEPQDGATNVSTFASFRIVFSEDMDPSTVVVTPVPDIPLTLTWMSSRELLVVPTSGWTPCAMQTLQVGGSDLAGHSLVSGPVPNPWTFSITCGLPFIVSTSPADASEEVPPGGDVTVAFSEPMDPASVEWAIAPAIRLVPSWSEGLDAFTLSLKEILERDNVTGDPDYYDGSADWLCRQRGPNSERIDVTANTAHVIVEIWAESAEGDNDLAVFRDANDNGVCDFGVDPLVAMNADADPNEVVTFANPPGSYMAQVGLWAPGSELFSLRVTHVRAFSPCTSYTATMVSGKDQAGNELVTGPAPNPWTFTTDCASPLIVSTSPPDGEVDVFRDSPVVVQFSEGMDPTSVVVAFTPPIADRSYAWGAQYRELSVRHALLHPCTTYRVVVSARDVAGNDLLPGAVPNPWAFTTSCAAPASVHVLSPAEGDAWTGGSDHSVRFEIENAETFALTFHVAITFRYAGGAGNGSVGSSDLTVPGNTTLTHEVPWTVPFVDATDVHVTVTIQESNLSFVADGPPFEIDSTSPTVLFGTPAGTRIAPDVELQVQFSEPLAVPPSDPLSIHPPVGRVVTWVSADRMHVGLSGTQPCTSYDVAIGEPLRDDSVPGNSLIPFSWSFATTCAPTIDLVTPVGGEDGTGGSVHEIAWTTEDFDDSGLRLTLTFSPDGGATWVAVVEGLVVEAGLGSYSWTLPRIDVADARVRAEVVDPANNSATDESPPFSIDSTPPSLVASVPRDGSTAEPTTSEIIMVWSERVNRSSFEAALRILPSVGSLSLAWGSGPGGAEVLTISHEPFLRGMEYTVSFAATAKDDSDPGNTLEAVTVVTFRTRPPPPTFPPTAHALGPPRATVGEPVLFDGRRSGGEIVHYEWRITDGAGRIVAALTGPLTSYAFSAEGSYRVVLTVRDVRGATDTDTLELTVTPNPTAWYLVAAGLLFAAGASTTEGGRFFVLKFLFVPLYARRRRNELLEHQTRGMILGYLMVHPGDTYSQLKRNLRLANGTLSYHLVVLEREGILRAQTHGVHKRFFPVGVRVPEDGGGIHEVQMRMLGAVREVPGLAVRDIAGALGITSQHALYHLRGLASKGFVRLERKGVRLRCFPEDRPRKES